MRVLMYALAVTLAFAVVAGVGAVGAVILRGDLRGTRRARDEAA